MLSNALIISRNCSCSQAHFEQLLEMYGARAGFISFERLNIEKLCDCVATLIVAQGQPRAYRCFDIDGRNFLRVVRSWICRWLNNKKGRSELLQTSLFCYSSVALVSCFLFQSSTFTFFFLYSSTFFVISYYSLILPSLHPSISVQCDLSNNGFSSSSMGSSPGQCFIHCIPLL